ncbi:MAG: T9SS type A sorting domain-containing protein [Bacteroidales bacterium]|nr:T9SS type A sorting domain-containing protein [Bacteroidales bacterium]
MSFRFNAACLILLFSLSGKGQEYLTGTGENAMIRQFLAGNHQGDLKTGGTREQYLMLPFFDDFAGEGIYPVSSLWRDSAAYINADYPVFPVSFGVATLDAIDQYGKVYKNLTTFSGLADRMTSRPVRLDSIYDTGTMQWKPLSPADSVYLSFYYQPQGRGVPPSSSDSLALDFGYYYDVFDHFDSVLVFMSDYITVTDTIFPGDTLLLNCQVPWVLAPDTLYHEDQLLVPCDSIFRQETKWIRKWSAQGDTLEVFAEERNRWFERVMIPLVDSAWFRKDFQFRFLNYASLSMISSWKSNTDQWHIDLVYLNANRSANDTTLNKISFAGPAPSFLNRYRSMPYYQYSFNASSNVTDSVELLITNLDSVSYQADYSYYFMDEGDTIFEYNGGSGTLSPFFSQGYCDYLPFSKPPVKAYFPYAGSAAEDSAAFRVVHVIRGGEGGILGDTIDQLQVFSNYFAYDDGTAEAGYGLSPAGAQLAYRFNLVRPDTLRAVWFYFNRVQGDINEKVFHLAVWGDNNGRPGALRYLEENILPVFTDSLNTFYIHHLEHDSLVLNGTFYIGWIQTSNHNLNIGYDRNTDASDHIFYNVEGSWLKTSFTGALMIRPVLGRRLIPGQPAPVLSLKTLEIYPNPPDASRLIHLLLPDELNRPDIRPDLEIRIFSLTGQEMYSHPFRDELNVSILRPGIYIISVFHPGAGAPYSEKLLISR